ncbi:MAG TPA: hypothetical protein VKZ50_19930 [bacterium]|nr:hypothetical protein [bacterium]
MGIVRVSVMAIVVFLVAIPPAARAQSALSPVAGAAAVHAFGVDAAAAGAAAVVDPPGIDWIRIPADWSAIEPKRAVYSWGALDAEIRQADAQRRHVVVLLEHVPQWAAMTPDAPPFVWSHQPPKRVADWSGFVAAAAQRYHGRVAAWQVEPSLDLADFRGTTRDYQEMLHAVRVAAGHADPNALVVAAAPGGLDLPYVQAMLRKDGNDFDAIMLYPRGRQPADVLRALSTIRARILNDARHQLWLNSVQAWGAPVQLAAVGLAEGVTREFWPTVDPAVTTAMRYLDGARFIGRLDRGPGVAALVFVKAGAPVVVGWTATGTQSVPLVTAGVPALVGATGQPLIAAPGPVGTVSFGPEPVFVTNPGVAVAQEAVRTAEQGPLVIPRDPASDFSNADTVSVKLGAVDDEHGLYNQRLRGLPSGAVVAVTMDGSPAVRTDPTSEAVYVYFNIDDSFAYFNDGRYDFLVTVEVHRASAAQLVGFNLMYDSMTGYRFGPWQWVDAGAGWTTYTFRISDADFSKTWGWDFAVNGAGDRKENLVVRSVTVKRVPASASTQ